MPLLMCPNCEDGMKQVNRENVQIDMCPSCHGVWLDRGELQKLLDMNRQDNAAAYAPPPTAASVIPPSSRPYPVYEQEHYHPHKQHHYKKSKLESLFDIFD